MKRVSLAIATLVVLGGLYVAINIVPETAMATVLFVGGSGPGNYTTIQDAITDSAPGDIVYVYNGTYNEHIVVDQPMSLIGEDRDTTIIDGGGSGDVVNVTANWVNISGFTVKNSGPDGGDAGIELYQVQNCHIANNTAISDTWGIFLDSSANNTVSNNSASYNRGGITLFSSSDNSIFGNTLYPGNTDGIFLYDSENNTISNNTSTDNGFGFYLWLARNNTMVDNDVHFNTGTGILMFGSNGNLAYHNNLVNNAQQAYDDGANLWDNGYPSGGNYWDNYTGLDLFSGPNQDQPGSDVIGDTPFVIDSDSRDRYPHMFPFGMGAPKPPTMLLATLGGQDFQNVTLAWSPSGDDGTGNKSVVGYQIYRNVSYDTEGLGYTSLIFLVNGTSEFVDVLAGEGNPNNYFYRVCALDVKNKSTCAEDQVAKFTRSLSAGPNLVSIPLIQVNETVETVLETLRFDKAWAYDSFDWKWESYMTFKPFTGELKAINHTMGIWVNLTKASNLTIAGCVPNSVAIQLMAGWNLVGSPSFNSSYTVADLKLSIGSSRIEGYDSLSSPYYLRELADFETLEAGYGYWIWIDNDTTWSVSNS
ncbi:MAG: right-handed parallel beta-helix repeat-containing protein [Thermoplasmata archaeon]|nr:right-handed parallel beta-helix repeat-containing protein [Thermoplasmata archaeon]